MISMGSGGVAAAAAAAAANVAFAANRSPGELQGRDPGPGQPSLARCAGR